MNYVTEFTNKINEDSNVENVSKKNKNSDFCQKYNIILPIMIILENYSHVHLIIGNFPYIGNLYT